MSRLAKALDELNTKAYALESIKQLSGGINSAVYQTKSSHGVNYILKLYPRPTRNDPRDRCLTEKNFLSYLQSCHIKNTSSILESNVSTGWSLMSWIEGEKPTSLEEDDIQDIANFIIRINKKTTKTKRLKLQPASEACESLTSLISNINQRLKRIESAEIKSDLSREAICWVSKNIRPMLVDLTQSLKPKANKCRYWKDMREDAIASPSDIGIHNMMRTNEGLFFIDFEYAGRDDLSKLTADLILHPEYCLSDMQEKAFLEQIKLYMSDELDNSWFYRLKDIKPLISIKWCLIMLNQIINNTLAKEQLEKTMEYFYQKTCVLKLET